MQLHHRLLAFLVLALAIATAMAAGRSTYLPRPAKALALALGAAVVIQVLLGVATLMTAVPLALGLTHQMMAALTFCLAVAFAWRVRRV